MKLNLDSSMWDKVSYVADNSDKIWYWNQFLSPFSSDSGISSVFQIQLLKVCHLRTGCYTFCLYQFCSNFIYMPGDFICSYFNKHLIPNDNGLRTTGWAICISVYIRTIASLTFKTRQKWLFHIFKNGILCLFPFHNDLWINILGEFPL